MVLRSITFPPSISERTKCLPTKITVYDTVLYPPPPPTFPVRCLRNREVMANDVSMEAYLQKYQKRSLLIYQDIAELPRAFAVTVPHPLRHRESMALCTPNLSTRFHMLWPSCVLITDAIESMLLSQEQLPSRHRHFRSVQRRVFSY